ncbi:MAG: amidohydrolase family protein [Dehalococcoidia bacterium]
MSKYDLLITGGTVLDPANNFEGTADVAISGGRIERVEPEINHDLADEVVEVAGQWVMPGMIDSHVHVAGRRATWEPALGYRMLARAGTTTAIDFGGTPETIIDGMQRMGAGLNVGGLFVFRPEETIPEDDPPPHAIRSLVSDALRRGALGVKMLGGYCPFTPEVTANIIAECNAQRAYIGYHVGTKETGSRIDGMREIPGLVGSRGRLHVAHINAYCRGSIDDPVDECREALSILSAKKGQYVSEVHQAIPNGTSGACGPGGEVLADVARNCLRLHGYPATADGIRQAIRDGYASVIRQKQDEIVYVKGEEALALFEELDTRCPLSFPVNLPGSAYMLTTARDGDGDFVVDAVSTDGGSHPRNIAIESTVALVKFGALSPLDMALKLSYNPSRMFGLLNKGHFTPGADADITVIDREAGRATATFVAGQPVLKDGDVMATGGTLLVTPEGEAAGQNSGLSYEVLDLTNSKLYAGFTG